MDCKGYKKDLFVAGEEVRDLTAYSERPPHSSLLILNVYLTIMVACRANILELDLINSQRIHHCFIAAELISLQVLGAAFCIVLSLQKEFHSPFSGNLPALWLDCQVLTTQLFQHACSDKR